MYKNTQLNLGYMVTVIKFYTKKFIKFLIRIFGFQVYRHSPYEYVLTRDLNKSQLKFQLERTVNSLGSLTNDAFKEFLSNNLSLLSRGLEVSKISYFFREKTNGFFVEFGACDGLHFSNTVHLEKDFNWRGILAEPNKSYFRSLKKNRNVELDNRAVWTDTGLDLNFTEASAGGLSGLTNSFRNRGSLKKRTRTGSITYKVKTVTLNDLLESHNCPFQFDFLSIDTEGSELDILKNFDLNKYSPTVIVTEFYGSEEAHSIIEFMSGFGSRQEIFSSVREDNLWFVKNN
jgi:FkbM family methyltransferase